MVFRLSPAPAAGTSVTLACDPEGWCVAVRAIDRAGNEGERARDCDEVDVDALLGRGCGCTSAPASATLSAGLLVLTLAGWRTRRSR